MKYILLGTVHKRKLQLKMKFEKTQHNCSKEMNHLKSENINELKYEHALKS